jgi:multimeric flavodoxin WrbA
MKVVAFNGSPRRGGNTETLLMKVLEPLTEAGIETELVQLGGRHIRGCTACGKCIERQDGRCVIETDDFNEMYQKILGADGIVLGSPTYFADVSTETKALIDRAGFVSFANGGLLKRKVGGAVIAVRRGGGVHAFDSINHLFLMSQMIVVGSTYWNLGYGLDPDDVLSDDEGLQNMRNLGEGIAWLLGKIGNC